MSQSTSDKAASHSLPATSTVDNRDTLEQIRRGMMQEVEGIKQQLQGKRQQLSAINRSLGYSKEWDG